ncbi:MAG: 16S rRNA (cytosine(1402)-N(4))-methyltransferase RsmH [Chlorobi bacterium]|nr:MAG: 16S rRNA (cytosine(1402)-N(4))-methyltransferase RsmH [Bacteroidota bacterium]MBE2265923.1 16S rRNA (cytosine(1402)-N(4))-methyltransferase RsmH [Flavobacteriales bacterium]MBL1160916.1 16S rRNA (cytosine(1402)-N(4))-methyltransferase RsmH [Chlorobiota bacterium]MBW7852877.1 16S rRNA (cytosine(1402)-N(4))-methyltransferase RsmH [Candidatus Kapabacteria bacterium]MCC6330892.1 16S rRNA (cytosine(1402)-N(4))-methyltransferase RsmH [Ignavibacteria bacterium]
MARLSEQEYHVPVMAQLCIDFLQADRGGVFVDATLGGGGHTGMILQHLPESGRLFSFDADDAAVGHYHEHHPSDSRHVIVNKNFSTIPETLKNEGPVQGILFDLGVSSYQFDHHPRGFSFRQEAPLDMRFGQDGITAADVLNTYTEKELANVFRNYGEDPSSALLARAIVRRRTLAPFRTTVDLRTTIEQHIPPQHVAKTLARIFQALRITVNRELDILAESLVSVLHMMDTGGRIVVLSYHSLEDRIVKDIFREYSRRQTPPVLTVLTKKPVVADVPEIERNPRSRSVRFRAAEIQSSYLRPQ